jgi:hypothetical protein
MQPPAIGDEEIIATSAFNFCESECSTFDCREEENTSKGRFCTILRPHSSNRYLILNCEFQDVLERQTEKGAGIFNFKGMRSGRIQAADSVKARLEKLPDIFQCNQTKMLPKSSIFI